MLVALELLFLSGVGVNEYEGNIAPQIAEVGSEKGGTYKEERHNRSTITTRPKVRPLLGPRGDGLILTACGHTKKEGQGKGPVLLMVGDDEK